MTHRRSFLCEAQVVVPSHRYKGEWIGDGSFGVWVGAKEQLEIVHLSTQRCVIDAGCVGDATSPNRKVHARRGVLSGRVQIWRRVRKTQGVSWTHKKILHKQTSLDLVPKTSFLHAQLIASNHNYKYACISPMPIKMKRKVQQHTELGLKFQPQAWNFGGPR